MQRSSSCTIGIIGTVTDTALTGTGRTLTATTGATARTGTTTATVTGLIEDTTRTYLETGRSHAGGKQGLHTAPAFTASIQAVSFRFAMSEPAGFWNKRSPNSGTTARR